MSDYEPSLSDEAIQSILAVFQAKPGQPKAGSGSTPTQTAHRLVTGGSFVLDQPDETPAVWGAGDKVLWAEGEGLMIAGAQGLGKTTLAGQLIKARMGIGVSHFLGYPVKQSDGKVLMLAMDRPSQAARSLQRMMTDSDRAVLDQKLLVWKGPTNVKLLNESSALADWIDDLDPEIDCLVIDSLKDLASGLSKDDVGAAINLALQEIIARGTQVLVLHHERKMGAEATKRAPSLDNIYGSTWLTSGLGSVLQLIGTPGDPEVELHHVKQPAEEVGPLRLLHDHKAGVTTVEYQLSVEDVLKSADANGVTIKDIAEFVEVNEATVRRRVNALHRDGLVVQVAAAIANSFGKQAATYRWNIG